MLKKKPWPGILEESAFVTFSTTNSSKVYSIGQSVFGRDIILLIKHKLDWELIPHQKQMQINNENIHKKIKYLTMTIKLDIK